MRIRLHVLAAQLFRPSLKFQGFTISNKTIILRDIVPCCDTLLSRSMSSSANSSRYQYEPINDVERFERYRPGGYHPVNIGDEVANRYKLVHKLGHGTFSTTWLARDKETRRCVAVKVGSSDSNAKEFSILSKLNRLHDSSAGESDRALFPLLLDSFKIQGPHGVHPCYVTPAGRSSLSAAKEESFCRLFQLQVSRAIAAQFSLAVAFMHTHGFVHGDLHLGNILLQLPPCFSELSDEQIYEEYDDPQLEPAVRYDGQPLPAGVPSHGVVPIWLGKASEDITLAEAKVMLSDYGETFSPSKESRFESHTPMSIRCPEAFFEPSKSLSFPSDIWTLACSIWDIMSQRPLFDGFLATQDDIISENVDAVGILPPQWWTKWEARHRWFNEDGTPTQGRSRPAESLEDQFEGSIQSPRRKKGMTLVCAEEKDAFLSLMRQMLQHKPETRITVQQVLQTEWMIKWALAEYENIRKLG